MKSVIEYQSLDTVLNDCFKKKTGTKDWIARMEAWEMVQGRCQGRTGNISKAEQSGEGFRMTQNTNYHNYVLCYEQR